MVHVPLGLKLAISLWVFGVTYFGEKKPVFLATHFEQLCCHFLAFLLPKMCYEIEK